MTSSKLGLGELLVSLTATGTPVHVVHESACPEIGPICEVRDEPAQLHDQRFYVGELRALLEVGFTETVSFVLQVPFRLSATTIVYRRLDGALFEPDYPNIHHRNQTLFGVGDPWFSARGGWSVGGLTIGARAGLTVPFGKTETNPFKLGREGKEHQHVQFGTGTVDPVLGVEVSYPIGRFAIGAYGLAQLSLYESGRGFQAGSRLTAGVSGSGPIFQKLKGAVTVDVANEQPERWEGRVEQDGNLGRTDLLVGVSLSYPVASFLLSLGVKLPVYQQVIQHDQQHPGQLSYPLILTLGVSSTVDVDAGR